MLAKKRLMVAMGLVLAGAAGCATSDSTMENKARANDRNVADASQVDRNGDGRITREEASQLPPLAKEFDRIDANRDDILDREEIAAYHHGMANHHGDHHRDIEARFKQADKDGDGALTIEEAKAGKVIPVVHHFEELDTDRNGKVTIAELKAAGMDQPHHGKHGHHGKGKPHGSSKYY